MSDERRIAKVSEYEAYKKAHREQIELIKAFNEGELTTREFLQAFADAADFDEKSRRHLLKLDVHMDNPLRKVWGFGSPDKSLFANLPSEYTMSMGIVTKHTLRHDHSYCPVWCNLHKPGTFKGLPDDSDDLKYSGPEVFEEFSRIQLEARFGSG